MCVGGSLLCSPAQYAPDGVQKILIGNKADEEHKRQVPKEQGLQVSGGCSVPPPPGDRTPPAPPVWPATPNPPLHSGPRQPSCSPTSIQDPQASPAPPSMTRDPPPSCSPYPGTPETAPPVPRNPLSSTPAVVVHPQGSPFPTCKMFKDP